MGVCDWSAQSVTVKTAENKLALKTDSPWLCWALLLSKGLVIIFTHTSPSPGKKTSPERPLGFVASRKTWYFPPLHFYLIIELWTLVVMQHSSVCVCGQGMPSGFAVYTLGTQMRSWIQACSHPKLAGQMKTAFLLSCSARLAHTTQQQVAASLTGTHL